MKQQLFQKGESGFVMVTMLTLLIPLVVVAAALTSTMNGRASEFRAEYEEELALLAAESGIDDAIFRGRIGTLVGGSTYSRTLGLGQVFKVEPTYLKTDGIDNDGDTLVDEDDEDVFQVIVIGAYRDKVRRIAAYLGPVPLIPPLGSPMNSQDPSVSIDLMGTPMLDGGDYNIDGSAGPGPALPGLAIAPPGTVAHLDAELSPSEESQVVGTGPTPSIDTGPGIDVTTIVSVIQNIANIVLTSSNYSSYTFGDASLGQANITYRNGNVSFKGNSQGSGIMLVTGDLNMSGNFRFDGIIIVLGKISNSAGTAFVNGAILQGPSGGLIETKGTFDLRYSSEAIALANSISGRYVAFNGWQELAR
ncbi:MAG: hypothetical protein ACYTG5_14220 [Planctomycetota bacterium]